MNEPTTKDIFDALLSFRDAVELRFVKIDSRFDRIDLRFDGVDRRLDGIDRRLDGHDSRLDRIDLHLGEHDRRFVEIEETMRSGFSDVRERLGRLEAQRT